MKSKVYTFRLSELEKEFEDKLNEFNYITQSKLIKYSIYRLMQEMEDKEEFLKNLSEFEKRYL